MPHPAQHFTWCTLHVIKEPGWQYTALMYYSFPNLEPVCCFTSSSNCCFFTCIQISQESGRVAWYFPVKEPTWFPGVKFTYGRKWRGTEEPLDESDRGEWKSWLKTQHLENKDHVIQSIISWQVDWKTVETMTRLSFLASKITADGDCILEIKKMLALWKKRYDQPR